MNENELIDRTRPAPIRRLLLQVPRAALALAALGIVGYAEASFSRAWLCTMRSYLKPELHDRYLGCALYHTLSELSTTAHRPSPNDCQHVQASATDPCRRPMAWQHSQLRQTPWIAVDAVGIHRYWKPRPS